MTPPEIHVLCYNNVSYTLTTAAAYGRIGHKVHLWDNGSTEENVERLKVVWSHPGVSITRLHPDPDAHRNKKVGGGKNAQLEFGIRTGKEWIVQSDNDIYLSEGWWPRMEEYLEAFPEVRCWGFYLCSNHLVVKTVTRGALTIRIPSMLSGTVTLVHCPSAKKIRWPEEPVDYSSHPFWHHMDGFDGVDVEFHRRFEEAGWTVALPQENFATHMWQPGREGGYV